MAGSGLQELFSTVFAENTTEHMLTGKAYSKAVRAHMLVQLAIGKLVIDELRKTNPTIEEYYEDQTVFQTYIDATDACVTRLRSKVCGTRVSKEITGISRK